MPNTARGWRRIGIVLSVIWFLGFGVFLWETSLNDLVRPYAYQLKQCGYLIDSSALPDYLTPEMQDKLNKGNWDRYHECEDRAKIRFEEQLRNNPDSLRLVGVLGVDLITIGLGWMFVWGCVAVVRWIRRGFADAA
jgi:hypothetical protein